MSRAFVSASAFAAEARQNLRLALPLMAAQLSFVGMHTLDTVMAGRLGAVALASVAVGTNVWFMSMMLFMGLFMAVSPIVAHRVGAGRSPIETGELLRGVLVLAILLGLFWMAALRLLASPVLDLLQLDAATRAGAEAYLHVILWAAVPFCLCFALRNISEGHGLTLAPLVAGVAALLANGVANYVLMYGKLGFPALGAVGTAWGTLIGVLTMLAVYLLLYRFNANLRALSLFSGRPPRFDAQLWEVMRLGLPVSAMVVAESWLFSGGALVIARFGGDAVAAHQIAINFSSLVFMVPLSIGLATTVRVGMAAGAGQAADAALRGRAGIGMGMLFACLSAALMSLAPGPLVALYTDAPELAPMATRFLMLAAVFQLFDCVQATANGALRGLKDTRVPMAVTISAYWLLGMPLAVWLAFRTEAGPAGVWYGFIAGLAVAALGLSARFLRHTAELPRRSVLMP